MIWIIPHRGGGEGISLISMHFWTYMYALLSQDTAHNKHMWRDVSGQWRANGDARKGMATGKFCVQLCHACVDQRLDACGLREHPSLGQSHTAQCGCENATKEKKKNPSAEAIVPGRFLWASGRSSEDRHGDFAWELWCGQGGWSLLNSFCFQSNTNFKATQSTCNMDSWLADGIHWICFMCRRIQCLICNLLDRWRSFLCQWSEPQFRIMAKNHSRKLQSTWMKLGETEVNCFSAETCPRAEHSSESRN